MIYKELTNEYTFWEWQQQSDSYKDQFSLEGAKALFNYFSDLSEELAEDMSFDPIAWLCDFSEYDSLDEAHKELVGEDDSEAPSLEYFQDRTTVIELNNGHLLIGAF